MEAIDFLRQPGVLQLCLINVGLAVLLIIVVWALAYRRSTRRKRALGELPPEPGAVPGRPGIWRSIVNFFMEPPKEDKMAESQQNTPESLPQQDTSQGEASPAQPAADLPVEQTPLEMPTTEDILSAPVEDAEEPETPAGEERLFRPVVSFGAQPAGKPAEATVPVPAQPVTPPTPPAGPPADAVEVMRVWRDLADGSLIVDFGGQRYRNLTEMQDPDLRRRFVGLVHNLNQMAGLEAQSARLSTSALAPSAGATVLPGTARNGEDRPPHMLRQLGRIVTGQSPVPAPPPPRTTGIVDEIEDFLQYKLQHAPAFSGRSIHIRQSVAGVGVSIEVDGHFYEGVGDVVDPDVREFLQATVQEWQARQ